MAGIAIGTALLNHFHWVIYILGLFLIYTGIKLCAHDDEFDPEASLVVRVSRKLFRVSTEDHGQQFFAREAGKLCITPLFLVLLVIDFVDIAFALDSVPADRLVINPDCGLRHLPGSVARAKLAAMAEGARAVRSEL